MKACLLSRGIGLFAVTAAVFVEGQASLAQDKLTFHQDAARSGWNSEERILSPKSVASRQFGAVWQSPVLDSYGDVAPRLFATPLYMRDVPVAGGRPRAAVFAVTATGYAYAIAATAGTPAAGSILWRSRLTAKPCADGTSGNLATPVIDRTANRIYVTTCEDQWTWQLHALDLRSGTPLPGWPLPLTAATIDRPGLNRNGTNRYKDDPLNLQRGALALSQDGARLYVTIGRDSSGWLVVVDTGRATIASTFSTVAKVEEDQGGLWASAGVTVDPEGRLYVASGSKFIARARKGIAGIFPDSPHHWSQSVLQLRDDRTNGLTLTGTYTPFNYCTAGSNDIDLGSSGIASIDLPAGTSATGRLLALGGKQGNFYLLDRDHLPGSLEKRQACTTEPDRDQSLLAPDYQPHFGLRGPINLFGPYSDYVSMLDQAKSRSTPAYWQSDGVTYVFATGSTKTGKDFSVSIPPGLARLKLVTEAGKAAHPEVDALEETQTFHNPASPVISSNGGKDAVVWVLDTGGPRTASLYGPEAPKAVLYAFDAATLKLLWKNAQVELGTTGKYNEATIADGMVIVGTDRIEAFGLRAKVAAIAPKKTAAPVRKPVATPARKTLTTPTAKPAAAKAAPPPALNGQRIFQARCASCHGRRQPGTPSRADLARKSHLDIVASLTRGPMAPMARGLSKAEIDAVAGFTASGR